MDGTPKLQRKASLSLSTRLNQKRHSASPQNRLRTSTLNGAINSRELNTCETLQRSPSVISICSDGGIECTPPHKKMAMQFDESFEFSPKILDRSFSPTCLLSQTLAIDSPEVGWKWSRHSANGVVDGIKCIENTSMRTPDSAYAADSSYASAGSSTTGVPGNNRKRSDSYKQRIENEARKVDQRKMLEQEFRRVEKTREEEKLKQRCAKLQEQLKSAGTQRPKISGQQINEEHLKIPNISLNDVEIKNKLTNSTFKNTSGKFQPSEKPKYSEFFNDFFNDSDSDCFLLEATQEIESKLKSDTQPAFINISSTTPKSSTSFECTSVPLANSAPAANSTPPIVEAEVAHIKNAPSSNIQNKNKRSFYMQFLEDDCPDDWFISLDEVNLEAMQNKKPRTPLQRYNSMPAESAVKSNITLNKKDNNGNCILNTKTNSSNHLKTLLDDPETSSSTHSKMKRHSSTHTLTPAGTNFRSRRQL